MKLYLIATLGVDINGGQEARLRGVGVNPAHRVQIAAILGLEYLLFR